MVDHHFPLHYFADAASATVVAAAYGDHYHNIENDNENMAHRELTFLDTVPTDDIDAAAVYSYPQNSTNTTAATASGISSEDIAFISAYALLAAGFILVGFFSTRATWTCHELYEWNAIRLILPAVAIIMCFECFTLAYDTAMLSSSATSYEGVPTQWAIAVYMLEATVAPGIFIFTFVLTFLSYRIRSMPFCFVYRGPSRQAAGEPYQDEDEEVVQPLVRPAVLIVGSRLFSLFLLVLALVVNFDVVWNEDNLAGRTGWLTVIEDPTDASIDHVILALIPMALTCVACLYFSLLLWRYGCEFSMVIYPSIINPWMFPLIGTGCMIAGQMFGPDLFPILSNSGIFLFMTSIVRTLYEGRHDIQQSSDLGHFLSALGKDRIANTVSGVEKATNGDTASTGRFDGTLSASILCGSAAVLSGSSHPSSIHGSAVIEEESEEDVEPSTSSES